MPTQLIAHRGGSGLRVENTLAAFEHAIELGAYGAELDAHLSRDGQVVVHHDDRLNPGYCRHVGGNWIDADAALPISMLSYAELQAFDISKPKPDSDYARRHPRIRSVEGQRIPLLREVIRLVKSRSQHFVLVIEIKSPELDAARKPWTALVDASLAVIDVEGFAARSILCSFDWGALRYAKSRHPRLATWFTSDPSSWFDPGQPPVADIPPEAQELARLREARAGGDAPWFAGFDPRRFAGSYVEAIAAAGGNAWFPFHRDCTARTCQESAQLGLDSAAWSANLQDRSELARLVRAGLGYLVVDYPDVDLNALA